MNLKNKKILITGATGGIGNSLVEKFYKLESNILATGTNEEKLEQIKKKYPNVTIEKFKLDEHNKIEEFIDNVDKKLNGIDILVNNAGITLDNLSIRLSEDSPSPGQSKTLRFWEICKTRLGKIWYVLKMMDKMGLPDFSEMP